MKTKKRKISYPSRVNDELISQINEKRIDARLSWPELTEHLLRLFLQKGTALWEKAKKN